MSSQAANDGSDASRRSLWRRRSPGVGAIDLDDSAAGARAILAIGDRPAAEAAPQTT